MALVDRWFSTAAAGAGDGTSWANRAALIAAGAFSNIITGHDFSVNGLRVRPGPGTYALTTALTTGSFANAPTPANPIIWHGCDGSGNLLTPPNPDWISPSPAWDDSALPVIATSTNIVAITGTAASWFMRLVKFTGSARQGPIVSTFAEASWCSFLSTLDHANAAGPGTMVKLKNSLVSCTGANYAFLVTGSSTYIGNCRLTGVAGTGGTRDGINQTNASVLSVVEGTTVIGVGGRGFLNNSGNVAQTNLIRRSMFIGCGGDALQFPSTALQTFSSEVSQCYIANNTGFGINAQSEANVSVGGCRLRDNTAGNFNGMDNYPTDHGNYTTDGDDTEFVNAVIGDYRLRPGTAIYGGGYGPMAGAAVRQHSMGGRSGLIY